jgi:DNA-binding beta-propeller fold protein YncE
LGVALLGRRLFVGNATKGTVEVYDAQGGELQRSFGPGAVEHPSDLAVDEILGLVFAVDGATRQVKVFRVRGTLHATISGPGLAPEQLQTPIAVAVDPLRAEVYVSDYGVVGGHAAVKIFDYNGTFIDEISGAGSCGMLGCSGGFSRPQGVAVDRQGKIYVADALLAQVLVYDRATLEQVEVLGSRDAGLRLPLDVALGADGEVYVTSNRTHSVELLVSGGAP